MRPDKQKVVDEVWDDARIRGFLDKAPLGEGVDADFSALLYAYRSMRPGDFGVFIGHFMQAGRNLDARGEAGETLAELIAEHRHSAPFLRILEDARAASNRSRAHPSPTSRCGRQGAFMEQIPY